MLEAAARSNTPINRAVLRASIAHLIPTEHLEEAGDLRAAAIYTVRAADERPTVVCLSYTFDNAVMVLGTAPLTSIQIFGQANMTQSDEDNRSYVLYELVRLLVVSSTDVVLTVPEYRKRVYQDRWVYRPNENEGDFLDRRLYTLSVGIDSVGTAFVAAFPGDNKRLVRVLEFTSESELSPHDVDIVVGN